MGNSIQTHLPVAELSVPETFVSYLTVEQAWAELYHPFKVAESTFRRRLREIVKSGRHSKEVFRYADPLSVVRGHGTAYYRIEVHPVLGVEVLDEHFGIFRKKYGVRRGV